MKTLAPKFLSQPNHYMKRTQTLALWGFLILFGTADPLSREHSRMRQCLSKAFCAEAKAKIDAELAKILANAEARAKSEQADAEQRHLSKQLPPLNTWSADFVDIAAFAGLELSPRKEESAREPANHPSNMSGNHGRPQ